MNFMDAVNEMQAGKRLIRTIWTGFYVAILPNNSYIWTIPNSNTTATINASIYVASVDDMTAVDWQIKTK